MCLYVTVVFLTTLSVNQITHISWSVSFCWFNRNKFAILLPSFGFINFSNIVMYSCGNEYQDYILLKRDTIGRWVSTFWNNLLTPSSWLKVKGAGSSEMLHPRRLTLISNIFQKLHADQMEAEHCHFYGRKCHWIFILIKLEIILKWRCEANCSAKKSNSHSHICYANERKWREGLKTVMVYVIT